MNKINRIQNQGIASTEARRQGALRLLRFAAALAGDSTPLLRLKRLGVAETTTPLFLVNSPSSDRPGAVQGAERGEANP